MRIKMKKDFPCRLDGINKTVLKKGAVISAAPEIVDSLVHFHKVAEIVDNKRDVGASLKEKLEKKNKKKKTRKSRKSKGK